MPSVSNREKLYDYIRLAPQKKIDAILAILEDEFEAESTWSENKNFVAEIEKRSKDLQTGKTKGLSLDEIEQIVRKKMKMRKTK